MVWADTRLLTPHALGAMLLGFRSRQNSSTSVNSQFRAGLKYLQTSLLSKRPFENREESRADVLVRAPDAGTWQEGAPSQDLDPISCMCIKMDSILDAEQERMVFSRQHFSCMHFH